ncbi:MAG: LysR family transcriptional regulator [Clostridiales bacterium]|nr:LysR family transcriptional regulator [Clostridiales bacterium]
MELTQLRYVIKLAQTANYSRAASELYITQPALSQQINALEKELGLKLFTRSTKAVQITPAGKEFVRGAQEVLTAYDELSKLMDRHRRNLNGALSVGLLSTLSHLDIIEKIGLFQQEFPNIRINMQIGWSHDLINRVLNRQLDAAITNIYFPKKNKPDPKLNIFVLFEDHIVLLANRKRIAAGQDTIPLNDLGNYPFILLEEPTSIRMQTDELFQSLSLTPPVVCICPAMDSLIAMIQANLGVTLLSYRVAKNYLNDDLVILPCTPLQHTQTALVTPARKDRSDLLQPFENYLSTAYTKTEIIP